MYTLSYSAFLSNDKYQVCPNNFTYDKHHIVEAFIEEGLNKVGDILDSEPEVLY